MDVGDWLRNLGLGKYEGTFRENEIDGEVLPDLTRCCRWGWRVSRDFRRGEARDRLEQAFAVAHRHAEFFEVAVRQVGQNFGVDFVFAEQRLVLTETEAAQPSPNIHDRIRPAGINDGLIERACPGNWPRMTAPGPSPARCRKTTPS